jgi:hypothetical protein
MKIIGRWVLSIFLLLIAILMINKGIDLWLIGTNVDGDGIGIHFLGWEINDRVLTASIKKYAIGFFVTSVLSILIAFVLVGDTFIKSNKQPTN